MFTHVYFILLNNLALIKVGCFLIKDFKNRQQQEWHNLHLEETFANSEDPDEMQHNAAFHQGVHFLYG